jgi:hypothetical protein
LALPCAKNQIEFAWRGQIALHIANPAVKLFSQPRAPKDQATIFSQSLLRNSFDAQITCAALRARAMKPASQFSVALPFPARR